MSRPMTIVLALAAALVIPVAANAQCPGVYKVATPYADETLTVSSASAIPFTAAKVHATIVNADGTARRARPIAADVSTTGGTLRIFVTGTTPTTTLGHAISAGTMFTICGGAAIDRFRGIAASSTVTLTVTYWE